MWARDTLPPVMIAFLVLNTTAVGLRVYVRSLMSKAFSYDDWAMLVAFSGFVVLCITTFISITNGYGAEDFGLNPSYDEIMAVKFFVISTLEYVIIVFIAKVSVALVLYRIAATNKPIRRLLEVSVGCMAVWTLATSTIVGLQCRPLSFAWGEGTGTCMNPKILGNTGFSISAMDIISSFLYASLPVFLLRGVQLSLKMKISVIILLGLGVLSSVATVVRLKCLVDVANLKSAVGPEAMNAYLTTFVYSITELGITIFTASVAALRPLIKMIKWGRTEVSGYGISSNKKSQRSRPHMGPPIRLDNVHSKASTSEEYIIPKEGAAKNTHAMVTCTEV
ncbi:hypothetical protein K458DRAFT_384522 [Lentithecium fluviatile CBS 122367]|uniref:Rhodopsin domain-containing protein n=1 Tax=Lentithecium fluviatile CBS 122367 TaxID=1168545 RepID=A0A6G1JD28_9PLEO|nr:hypothetical protein K458DRAFT_384522 [Lentithecium fluviatile CBS 122367]